MTNFLQDVLRRFFLVHSCNLPRRNICPTVASAKRMPHLGCFPTPTCNKDALQEDTSTFNNNNNGNNGPHLERRLRCRSGRRWSWRVKLASKRRKMGGSSQTPCLGNIFGCKYRISFGYTFIYLRSWLKWNAP